MRTIRFRATQKVTYSCHWFFSPCTYKIYVFRSYLVCMRRVDSWQPTILIAKLSGEVRQWVCRCEMCLSRIADYSK